MRTPTIQLTPAQEQEIQKKLDDPSTADEIHLRLSIVRCLSRGDTFNQIAGLLDTSAPTICKWTKRYRNLGIDGLLEDAPRPGRPPVHDPAKLKQAVTRIWREIVPPGKRWNSRSIAQECGASRMRIHRLLESGAIDVSANGNGMDLGKPDFLLRLLDFLGVYLCPPENALVLLLAGPHWRRPSLLQFMEENCSVQSGDISAIAPFWQGIHHSTTPLETYLSSKLPIALQEVLSRDSHIFESSARQLAIALNNKIIRAGPLYSEDRFAGVRLDETTQWLLDQKPNGSRLALLNRLLLEAGSQGCLRSLKRNLHLDEAERPFGTRFFRTLRRLSSGMQPGVGDEERKETFLDFLDRIRRYMLSPVDHDTNGPFNPLLFEAGKRIPAGTFEFLVLCSDSPLVCSEDVREWFVANPDFQLQLLPSGRRWLQALKPMFDKLGRVSLFPSTFQQAENLGSKMDDELHGGNARETPYDSTMEWSRREKTVFLDKRHCNPPPIADL